MGTTKTVDQGLPQSGNSYICIAFKVSKRFTHIISFNCYNKPVRLISLISFPSSSETDAWKGNPTEMCSHVPPKACTRWVIATVFTMAPKCPSSGWRNTHECNTVSSQQWEQTNWDPLHKRMSLSNILCVKDVRHKRENTVWFHLCKFQKPAVRSQRGDGGDGAGEWRDLWRHKTCSVSWPRFRLPVCSLPRSTPVHRLLLSESHCSLESGEKSAGQELFLWFLIHRFHAYLFPFISPASEKLNLIMTHWGSLSERSRVALGWLRKSWTPCPRLLSQVDQPVPVCPPSTYTGLHSTVTANSLLFTWILPHQLHLKLCLAALSLCSALWTNKYSANFRKLPGNTWT